MGEKNGNFSGKRKKEISALFLPIFGLIVKLFDWKKYDIINAYRKKK